MRKRLAFGIAARVIVNGAVTQSRNVSTAGVRRLQSSEPAGRQLPRVSESPQETVPAGSLGHDI